MQNALGISNQISTVTLVLQQVVHLGQALDSTLLMWLSRLACFDFVLPDHIACFDGVLSFHVACFDGVLPVHVALAIHWEVTSPAH